MKTLLAFLGAVIVGYVVYAENRQRANVDLGPVLNGDEHLAHLPHPWSTTTHYEWSDPT